MADFLQPVTLENRHVRLEPLALSHADDLREATLDGRMWEVWVASAPRPEAAAEYIGKALAMQADGTALAFAVRAVTSGRIVGSTRYYHGDAHDRHLTIGYTWYAASAQHTAINTAAKSLLLAHAFDTLGMIRVEFCTHWLNLRSRAAIARLGAKQEAVLRNHHVMADGSFRDTVVFSIIASEWPGVKHHLAALLDRDKQA